LAACQRKRLRFLRFSFTQRAQRTKAQAIAVEWKPDLSFTVTLGEHKFTE